MNNHTPGPWTATRDIVERWHVDSEYHGPGSDYTPVADVHKEADARLIASAPRLQQEHGEMVGFIKRLVSDAKWGDEARTMLGRLAP